MSYFSALQCFLMQGLHIFGLRDIVEILCLTMLIYYLLIWLKKDTQKNLIFIFYSYCIIAFGAYYGQFFTISSVFFNFAPDCALLFS